MSSYLSFFIRNKNDFLPIGTFCRSSEIYQITEKSLTVPYAKIMSITKKDIKTILDICEERIKNYNEAIISFKERIDFIKNCNNSLEDKLEEYNDYDETIRGYEDGIEEVNEVKSYFNTLDIILEDISYTDTFDQSKYIYCGIEVGYNVNLDDIMGEID